MSDHFDGRRYFNPMDSRGRGFFDVVRWMLTRKKHRWPKHIIDPPQPDPPQKVGGDELAVTFVNHSTFLVQTAGFSLLTDPIWSERASPLSWAGPSRVRAPGVAFDRLPEIDVVLISHNHYDHLDLPTLRRLASTFAPTIVTSLGNKRFLEKCGLSRIHELDWWHSAALAPTLEVTLTPARHFSARTLFDRDKTLWGGFLIRVGSRTIYFAGDSAYPGPFVEVGKRAGTTDVALLPFAAYEPRWFMRAAHMNPEEAVLAHVDLGSPFTIGMHFGTFQLTDEPIDEPERLLLDALHQRRLDPARFRVRRFGETIYVPLRPG